jgi:hypothetical protein
MRASRRIIVWGLGSFLCLSASSCGVDRGSTGIVVASVAGAEIGSKLLDDWTRVTLTVGGARSQADASRQALGLLILWQWTAGEAQALHVKVTTAEAGAQLALSQANQNVLGSEFELFRGEHTLKSYLASPKVSQENQLTLVKMAMLAARVATRHAALAEDEIPRASVVAYYDRYHSQFRVGERRDIKAIMNWSKAMVLEAKHEMQAGIRFHTIEERFNQSVEGGLRLGRARGAQTKRYERDYFAAPPHVLIGPRKELMYYVFEVMSIRPSFERTLAEAEPAIRRRLAAPQQGAAQRAYEQRWRERTVCRSEYQARRCGKYATELG